MQKTKLSEDFLKSFESYLKDHALPKPKEINEVWETLWSSQGYSLCSGGKRFRPLLSLHTAQALGISVSQVLPFATAVEMIHTYSLIHDDLPCLDNDDERRGVPTNHIKFGEDMALLAGDSLLTDAFGLLGRAYSDKPQIGLKLVSLLSEAAGPRGMIGGQVMDIAKDDEFKSSHIRLIHKLKTGALIRVSVEGIPVIGGMNESWQTKLGQFGEKLGFAFQLADDILDHDPEHPESTSFIAVYGLEKTQSQLKETSGEAMQILKELGLDSSSLAELIEFNQQRKH